MDFNCQSCGDWKFSIVNPMVIKKTLVAPFCDDQKNLVAIKGGHVICFWKTLTPWQGLSKNIWHSPFPNNQKNSVAIAQWGVSNGNRIFSVTIQHASTIKWWLNFFGHHPTHLHHQMVTEFFRSPRRHWGDDFFFQKWYYMCPPAPPFQWSKNFSHHPTCPHHPMVTKRHGACAIILGEKNHPLLYLLGDQRILVTI